MAQPWYKPYLATVSQTTHGSGSNTSGGAPTGPGGGVGGGPPSTAFVIGGQIEQALGNGHMASGPNDSFHGGSFYMPFDTTIRGACFIETRASGVRREFDCGITINGAYTELFAKLSGDLGGDVIDDLEIAVSEGDWIEMVYRNSGNNYLDSIGMSLLFQDEVDTPGKFQIKTATRQIGDSARYLSFGEKNASEGIAIPKDCTITGYAYRAVDAATGLGHTVSLQVDGVDVDTVTLLSGENQISVTDLEIALTAGSTVRIKALDPDDSNTEAMGAIEFELPGEPTGPNQWLMLVESPEIRLTGRFEYGPVPILSDATAFYASVNTESSGDTDISVSVNEGAEQGVLSSTEGQAHGAVDVNLNAEDNLNFFHTGTGQTGEGAVLGMWFKTGKVALTSRYWRMLCTANDHETDFGISTLEFRSTSGGADTTDPAYTISSGPETGGNLAESAFNNSGGYVYWRDEKDESGQAWIGQDYGEGNETAVSEVLIAPPAGTNNVMAPLAFDMQVSDDGVTWTTAWSGACDPFTQDAQIVSQEGTGPTTPEANGWRLLVTETGTTNQVGIKTMQLRTAPGGPDAVDENNVEPNGESDAKTIAGGEYPSTAPFGGQFSSNGWRSAAMNPGANTWLAWVFYQPRAVQEVMIETDTVAEYAPLEFRIQYYDETFRGTDGQLGGPYGTDLLYGGSWVDAGVFSVVAEDYDGSNQIVLPLFE